MIFKVPQSILILSAKHVGVRQLSEIVLRQFQQSLTLNSVKFSAKKRATEFSGTNLQVRLVPLHLRFHPVEVRLRHWRATALEFTEH